MPSLRGSMLAAVALLTASCASAPEPVPSPELVTAVSHYAGDPIGGRLPYDAALDLELAPDDAIALRVELYVVLGPPAGEYEPLSESLRMVLSDEEEGRLGTSSLVAPGGRVATGPSGRAIAEGLAGQPRDQGRVAATFEALSLPEVTASMSAAFVRPVETEDSLPSERRVSVELWRDEPGNDDVSIAMVVSDVVEVVEDLATDTGPRVRLVQRHETLVLERRTAPGADPVVVVAPARFDPTGQLHQVLVVSAEDASASNRSRADLEQRLNQVRADVRSAALTSSESRQQRRLDDQLRIRRLRAIEALSEPDTRRAALVELAGASGAMILLDVSLSAEEETLTALVGRFLASRDMLESVASDLASLGWWLERETVLLSAESLADDRLPPEHEAILLRWTGEAGRYPGALEAAIATSDGIEDFLSRIAQENRIALEASSPAARVRAYDFLVLNGFEIPGFDPLGGARERRSALRAWREAEEAKASASATEEGSAP